MDTCEFISLDNLLDITAKGFYFDHYFWYSTPPRDFYELLYYPSYGSFDDFSKLHWSQEKSLFLRFFLLSKFLGSDWIIIECMK
ncbi:hypothetical protein HMPREF3187_01600 [Aerococcus christensenii]|uniref:Uncharacterized protein n=1 Tax=Aerococcus christensenii TaxID=87541 RepID=A0A133XRZ2_9LACT|nr:hypothetical protein HMPREF3187_01600 [Aerococcus christensenii]